jgi:transcriptional regulator with XRE-family HTH domain
VTHPALQLALNGLCVTLVDMTHADYYVPEALRDRLGERLTKSLKLSGITVEEMAAFIEVHRNTVSNWLGNRGVPANTVILRLWAEKVNLPYEYLRDGIWPDGVTEPPVEVKKPARSRSASAKKTRQRS